MSKHRSPEPVSHQRRPRMKYPNYSASEYDMLVLDRMLDAGSRPLTRRERSQVAVRDRRERQGSVAVGVAGLAMVGAVIAGSHYVSENVRFPVPDNYNEPIVLETVPARQPTEAAG